MEVVIDRSEARDDTTYLSELEGRLRQSMPENLILSPTENRAADRAAMTAAFRLNLTILSLIAILVGAYLILQALDAAVVRRRAEIATLRSLGVGSRVLFLNYLTEALALGLVGSMLGVGVGHILAHGAVSMLSDTVNALYFATSVEALKLTFSDLAMGLLIGLAFSMLAGWLPARDATQTPPAQVLSKGDWSPGFAWLRKPKVGFLLLLFGALALVFPPYEMEAGSKMPVGGFLCAGSWILGLALLSGHSLVLLAGWIRPLCKGPVFRLASSRLRDGSSRHRLAVAGLVVAVGMVTGMFQMIGTFETIEEWFGPRSKLAPIREWSDRGWKSEWNRSRAYGSASSGSCNRFCRRNARMLRKAEERSHRSSGCGYRPLGERRSANLVEAARFPYRRTRLRSGSGE